MNASRMEYPNALSITAKAPLGTWTPRDRPFTVGASGQDGIKLFSKPVDRKAIDLRFLLYDLRWKPYYSDKF